MVKTQTNPRRLIRKDDAPIVPGAITAMLEEMADAINDTFESSEVTDPAIIEVLNNLSSRIRSDANTVLGYETAQQE